MKAPGHKPSSGSGIECVLLTHVLVACLLVAAAFESLLARHESLLLGVGLIGTLMGWVYLAVRTD
jgi:hypothetical protein